ncbi:MAG: hypothetical protein MI861_23860 [Pirellulales bacterium]|nr:hypothetical protein [Pirellulales bacterium]
MSLEEAAAGEEPRQKPIDEERAADNDWSAFARFVHLNDRNLHADKYRREEALRAARERGLDGGPDNAAEGEQKPPRRNAQPKSRRRMNPYLFARTLLTQTSLPMQEIADITDLDIYEVVSIKLKLRNAA